MKFGMMGELVKVAFAQTAFDYMAKEVPQLEPEPYRKRVMKEYKAIVKRTPGIGKFKDNMFVVTLYAGCFVIALYKAAEGNLKDEGLKGLVRAAAYCPLMVKTKRGKSVFTDRIIEERTKQAQWSRDHIQEYPMNWFYYFENVPGKEEYYITHKECGICKLAKQEGCPEITKYLCMMDYYTFELQGAVLDRTKTLGYGDDECNFHVMSNARAEEVGFVKSPNAK